MRELPRLNFPPPPPPPPSPPLRRPEKDATRGKCRFLPVFPFLLSFNPADNRRCGRARGSFSSSDWELSHRFPLLLFPPFPLTDQRLYGALRRSSFFTVTKERAMSTGGPAGSFSPPPFPSLASTNGHKLDHHTCVPLFSPCCRVSDGEIVRRLHQERLHFSLLPGTRERIWWPCPSFFHLYLWKSAKWVEASILFSSFFLRE